MTVAQGADLSPALFHRAALATWPAARVTDLGPFRLRHGPGGGSRANATTVEAAWTDADLTAALNATAAPSAEGVFMVRDGEEALDAALARRGAALKDPTLGCLAPVARLATARPPPVTTFETWPPLAAQREIWAEGGIGPARIAVMDRAPVPKVTILGRADDRPAGALFAALSDGIAFLHAIEVAPRFRRRGLATQMIRAAAFWAAGQGATHIGLLVAADNAPARALYAALGMVPLGGYHYRVPPP